ncbi:MAG: TIGR04372 family glycosyltransferase [Parvibaculum sp.]|nr:TIGR04372 family glycosyltransferase [Parvibaculum sp.]
MEPRILAKEMLRSALGSQRSARVGSLVRYWLPRVDQNLYSFEQSVRRMLGGQIDTVYTVAQIDPKKTGGRFAALALMGRVEKLTRRRNGDELRKRFNEVTETRYATAPDLMFTFGNSFLRLRDLDYAMKAFAQFVAVDKDDGRFHSGRKLLDYLEDRPTLNCIETILNGFESVQGADVPDLAMGLIEAIVNWNEKTGASVEIPEKLYMALLPITLNNMGDKFLSSGDAASALPFYLRSIKKVPDDALLRLQVGVTYFLAGRYQDAERHWNILATTREKTRTKLGIGSAKTRLLGDSFFIAIGHTAYIDTYIKAAKLGWRDVSRIIVPTSTGATLPGRALFPYLGKYVEQVHYLPGHIDDVVTKVGLYDSETGGDKSAATEVRIATTDDFWYGPSADGVVKWFAPHGAEVERAWKAGSNGPLFSMTNAETAHFRASMESIFGLPRDAWFVGVHVRTPGFHQKWHEAHPGTRNAEIETYREAINWIVAQGGWVVRLGDSHMPPYAPHERVIDYATSEFRSPDFDVMFCATCEFFLGTNSGFSVVPAMFGKPCALTNWSPLAIPNWYLDDVYVPKLVREKSTGRLLTFREMFSSIAGWSQFTKDYAKANLEVVENDPEDLLDATVEVFETVRGKFILSDDDKSRIERFNDIALANNGFVGSRISARFLKRYEYLLD